MPHIKSERDGYVFPTEAAADYAANWWNEYMGRARIRAKVERLKTDSRHSVTGMTIPGAAYLVVIETLDDDGWIIADYLPTDRELWGQMLLPLDRAA